jgi:hypothetical protein
MRAGYASLADILPKFDKLNALPSTVQLSRLDNGNGFLTLTYQNLARVYLA